MLMVCGVKSIVNGITLKYAVVLDVNGVKV